MFIPKKIRVGYQNRSGTYTGKLAYVTYYGPHDKLRKERSWNGWRDKDIEPNDFENIPIEGFVLNKKVGGYDTGWNHRNTYARVYDPRGFEFEINIDNLLYILENTDAIKGKGLCGDFVYGWEGKDLVLIPTSSPDYKKYQEQSNHTLKKDYIRGKELKPGLTYETLKGEKYIYIGKFDYYAFEENTMVGCSYWYSDNFKWEYELDDTWEINPLYDANKHRERYVKKSKRFFFAKINEKNNKINFNIWKGCILSSVTNKFYRIADENVHPKYTEILEFLEHSSLLSPINFSKTNIKSMSYKEFFDIVKDMTKYSYVLIKYKSFTSGSYDSLRINYKENNHYRSNNGDYTLENIKELYDKYQFVIVEEYLNNGNKRENYLWGKEWDLYEQE